MSTEAFESALGVEGLKPQTKFILCILAHRVNYKTGRCDTSVRKLARDASMHPRTVHDHLRVLEERQEIEIEHRFEDGAQITSQYWLACDLKLRPSTGDGTIHPYGSVTTPKNLNTNPNSKWHSIKRVEGEVSWTNKSRQEAEVKLAGLLGEIGWEIMTTLPRGRVSILTSKVEHGAITDDDLEGAKAEFKLTKQRGRGTKSPRDFD